MSSTEALLVSSSATCIPFALFLRFHEGFTNLLLKSAHKGAYILTTKGNPSPPDYVHFWSHFSVSEVELVRLNDALQVKQYKLSISDWHVTLLSVLYNLHYGPLDQCKPRFCPPPPKKWKLLTPTITSNLHIASVITRYSPQCIWYGAIIGKHGTIILKNGEEIGCFNSKGNRGWDLHTVSLMRQNSPSS